MVFSDASFLFLFLPVALAISLATYRVAFAPALLTLSLAFYYWTAGAATLILLFSIVINYAGGRVLSDKPTRPVLACFIAIDLLLLAYFKYAGFLAVNFDVLAGTHVATFFGTIILPIGISFFTFQGISYLIDVYRGDVVAEPSLIVFGAYKAFFPQLIAGPIVRYRDVSEDFHKPRASVDLLAAGIARFAHGLLKKVLVADGVAPIADATFSIPHGQLSFASAWLGVVAYAIQIYFDFSAYSDMAIGLGAMLGIHIPENFDRPYSSYSITEFWRRWHISLTSWFRDYVYIPLGGNRSGPLRTYRNLLIVFLLVGIWHGAAWQFVAWGLYNGFFLIVERIAIRRPGAVATDPGANRPFSFLARFAYTLPVVLVGWAIFRAPDLGDAGLVLASMFSPASHGALTIADTLVAALASPPGMIALAIGLPVFFLPQHFSLGRWLGQPRLPFWGEIGSMAYTACACVIVGIWVLPGGYSPFLYFRF
jgi:alginate O-acetyltransferase complex protein AlgI